MKILKSKSLLSVLLIIALTSYGFTFDFQNWGKEQKKKTGEQSNPGAIKKSENKPILLKSTSEKSGGNKEGSTAPGETGGEAEILEIQNNIKLITEQTKVIERQGVADRARLQAVMQQVQIQKKLIDSLKTPKQPAPNTAVNTDEIIRQAKIRLIADDVRRTQENLRSSKTITPATKPVQIVKTRER